MSKMMLAIFAAALCGWMAQDEVENPQYKAWAKFKVGANVKYKVTVDMGGQKTDIEETQKLTELTAEKAVVEVAKPQINRTEPKEFAAKTAKAAEEGDEDVEAGGKTYKCHWLKYGTDKTRKVWLNDEVPGGVVKEEDSTGNHALVRLLVEFKAE